MHVIVFSSFNFKLLYNSRPQTLLLLFFLLGYQTPLERSNFTGIEIDTNKPCFYIFFILQLYLIQLKPENNASRLAFGAYDGVQALVCPASKVKAKFLNILKPFGIYTWLRKSV